MTAVSSISIVVGWVLERKILTVPSTFTNWWSVSTKSKSPMFGAFPKALPQIILPYALDVPLDWAWREEPPTALTSWLQPCWDADAYGGLYIVTSTDFLGFCLDLRGPMQTEEASTLAWTPPSESLAEWESLSVLQSLGLALGSLLLSLLVLLLFSSSLEAIALAVISSLWSMRAQLLETVGGGGKTEAF